MKRDDKANEIAKNGLTCISNSYDWAKTTSEEGFAPPTVLNASASVTPRVNEKARAYYDEQKSALKVMLQTPVIARVTYSKEDGVDREIYISRGPRPTNSEFEIASHNSKIARLASLLPGDGEMLKLNNRVQDVIVSEVVIFRPRKDSIHDKWDSIDTQVQTEQNNFTIPSLLGLLKKHDNIDDDPWADDTSEYDIVDGFRREILTGFGLRDNPILDKTQIKISWLPLNTVCFVSGPAGTGKTTTMIRRLGLKTNREHLEQNDDTKAIEKVEADTGRQHAQNWVMFSPTDLLKEYVKEAFNREGQAAPKERLKTWSDYRREIARDQLRLIRNTQRQSGFNLIEESSHLKDIGSDLIKWYEDFEDFRQSREQSTILQAIAMLKASKHEKTAKLGNNLKSVLDEQNKPSRLSTLNVLNKFGDRLEETINFYDNLVTKTIADKLNIAVNHDRNFPVKLMEAIIDIRDTSSEPAADQLELEEEGSSEETTESQMSRKRARGNAIRYLRTYAFSLAKGKTPKPESAAARLLKWLGPEYSPNSNELLELGKMERELRAARALLRFDRNMLSSLPASYRVYRRARTKEQLFYNALPKNQNYICGLELDILILSALTSLRKTDEFRGDISTERRPLLHGQVFVDEATDFSAVQIAAMQELAHPVLGSFFMTGDLNQRLEASGLKSLDSLDWVNKNLERYDLKIGYRQSESLLALANGIGQLAGFEKTQAEYAGYNDESAPKPEWVQGLDTLEKRTNWLAERIAFADKAGGARRISIAIFTPDSTAAAELVAALNPKVLDTGREVKDCSSGQTVTEIQHIGVYDIKHIKGLEFEAVFFVSLDTILQKGSDLALTTLYVGASRAANYLAITFDDKMPESLVSLQPYFK